MPTIPSVAPRRTSPALLLSLLALWLLATLGARPLRCPTKAATSGSRWEMLRSGDWLVPTLERPAVLPQAAAVLLDRRRRDVARSARTRGPAALAPLARRLAVGAVALLALRRWAGAATRASTLVRARDQPFFFVGAQFANLDMLVGGLHHRDDVLRAARALATGARRRALLVVGLGAARRSACSRRA